MRYCRRELAIAVPIIGRVSRVMLSALSVALGSTATISLLVTIYSHEIYNVSWVKDESSYPTALTRSQAVTVHFGSRDMLFVAGGIGPSSTVTDQVNYAILRRDGTLGGWQPTTHLPVPLNFHAAIAINGRIYVFGGGLSGTLLSKKVYCAQPDGSGNIPEWITTSLTRNLGAHAAVAIDNRIYIIGGASGSGANTDVVESASIGANCSTPFEWRTESSLRFDLANHSAVAVEVGDKNKFIYVIGGYSKTEGGVVNRVQRTRVYIDDDGKLGLWEDSGVVDGMPGMQLLTAVVSGEHLYAIGGLPSLESNSKTPVGTVYRAKIGGDGNLGPWASLNEIPALYGQASAVSSLGQIYLIGGRSFTSFQDSVFFTPLALFSKSAIPSGPVMKGDYITYTIQYTNNNLRPLHNVVISDLIPANTRLIDPQLLSNTTLLTWPLGTIPITGAGVVSFQVQVKPLAITEPVEILAARVSRANTQVMTTVVLPAESYTLICTFEEEDIPSQDQDAESADCGVNTTTIPYIDHGHEYHTETLLTNFEHTGGPAEFFIQHTGICRPGVPRCEDTGSINVIVELDELMIPLPVSNTARLCEGILWCTDSNIVANYPWQVYLPLLLRQ